MSEQSESPVQAPLPGSPQRSTGDPQVDAAVSQLAALGGVEVTEHAPIIEAAHDRLREVLDALDGRPPQGDPDA